MRIALLVTQFPTVSETFILHQITGLLDRGHEVDIYALRPARRFASHAELERYRLPDRTTYWGFDAVTPRWEKLTRTLSAGPALVSVLARSPATLAGTLGLIAFRRALSPAFLHGLRAFQRNGRGRYDIIHAHYGRNGTAAVLLRELGLLHGKVVTTFHGYDISGFVAHRGRAVYGALFRLGDLFLPVSERWRTQLVALGCDPERIVVHRLGVDTAMFRAVLRVPRPPGAIRLLTVARLVEKKGLAYALRAVAGLVSAWPQISYTIVGDGPLRERLAGLAGELGIGRHVRMTGPRTQEEVLRHLGEADLFVLPSVTSEDGDQEGIPVALMEAMAAGIPVVSSRHSGIPELVQDGVSGALVPERDVDALAAALRALLAHPERWAAMGEAGRDFVRRHYDLEAANDRLVGLYEALLRGEGRRVPAR